MAEYMNMDTLKWMVKDVHQVADLFKIERFQDYDLGSVDIFLETAKSWADQELYPIFKEMDENPCKFENGKVIVHPNLEGIIKQAGENGWIGASFDYDDGGSQIPHMITNAANHILESANNHFPGYIGLTNGAADLIRTYGTPQLKNMYLAKMISGEWMGTMCLTEPQAGSSLSDIKTKAIPLGDGRYKIIGQKIFISGGDHTAAENFVHPVLARIEGAPAGTKGISLFVVPKLRITENGLVDNHVKTIADFQKMGQRGYCTVHLVFGEGGDCYGHLLGEENKGLKQMFKMMNGARIDVGMTAASIATAAYYASLQYAKERPQGRKLLNSGKKDPTSKQTLIINHADVRRMLMLQKSISEGALSLLIEASKYWDLSQEAEGKEKEESHLLLELLTPITKTYPAEKGQVAVSNGLQVLGGYGYCSEFILQQYYRDIRIMAIYEGTTGIQSLDLLGRKVTAKNGAALQLLLAKINEVIEDAKQYDDISPYGEQLLKSVGHVQKVLGYLLPMAMKGDYESYLADATIFMDMTSTIVIAYQWLKMAVAAKKAIVTKDTTFESKFYESKIKTMQFYYKYELPKAGAAMRILTNPNELTVKEDENDTFFDY